MELPPLAVLENDAHLDRVDGSFDPAGWASHRLTPTQRRAFETDGVKALPLSIGALPRRPC